MSASIVVSSHIYEQRTRPIEVDRDSRPGFLLLLCSTGSLELPPGQKAVCEFCARAKHVDCQAAC